jgi:hypothetical protein
VFVSVAKEGGWDVVENAHIAFWQAPHYQRLYLEPTIPLVPYVKLWEGSGAEEIGGHSRGELEESLWPWLKENDCATASDDPMFDKFLSILGDRRQAHLRPSIRAERTWPPEEVTAGDVRGEVNRVLQAIGEPGLPV